MANSRGVRYNCSDGVDGYCVCVRSYYHGEDVHTCWNSDWVVGYPKFLNIRKRYPLYGKGLKYGYRVSDRGNRYLIFMFAFCLDHGEIVEGWHFLGGFSLEEFKEYFVLCD